MKSLFKRIKSIRGFTLVELLVVIAIIGVLAAIIIPNVSGLSGSGQTEAAAAEKATLQAAMDTMMAKTGLTTVGTISSATSSMSSSKIEVAIGLPQDIRRAIDINYRTAAEIEKRVQDFSQSPGSQLSLKEELTAKTPIA